LEDFLGGIAGMYKLLMFFILTIFGDYLNFIVKVLAIRNRYKFKVHSNEHHEHDNDHNHDEEKAHGSSGHQHGSCKVARKGTLVGSSGFLDIKIKDITWFYIKYESSIKNLV
jgi:hypothetical protein